MNLHNSLHLAAWLGGIHHGPVVDWIQVAPIETAGREDLSFCLDEATAETHAGVLLLKAAVPGRCCICVDDPMLAFILVLERMFPVEQVAGISDDAHIDPGAFIHGTATIHAGVVVMNRCTVGAYTVLFPNVVLYPKTEVGAHCRIHAGAVIGADGFGHHATPEGPRKVPQIGRVVIEDHVEIGANATIDRAFLGETRIGGNTKLDNLVHVGHNSRLGRGVIIAAQAGLSGSVDVGDGVMIGGQAGIVEHTKLGAQARVGAQSGVLRDVDTGQSVLGSPAEPAMRMKRIYAALRAGSSPAKED